MFSFSRVRVFNWALIVMAFFLPLMRGCNDQIVYPYHEIKTDEAVFSYIPAFFYPIFLLFLWFLFGRIKNDLLQWKIVLVIYCLLFALFSYAMFRLVVDSWRSSGYGLAGLIYIEILATLWGIMFLGLAKIKSAAGLFIMISFILTAVGLWWLPILVLFAKKLLIGAWVYIVASAIILLTFLWEYFYPVIRKRLKLSCHCENERSSDEAIPSP